MSSPQSLLDEIAELIVRELNLQDIDPQDIDPDARLFGEGLGLDSIDALELALAISKTYGVKIRSSDDRNVEIFSSLRSLADYVSENRPE